MKSWLFFFGGGEAAETKVSNSDIKEAEKAFVQAVLIKTESDNNRVDNLENLQNDVVFCEYPVSGGAVIKYQRSHENDEDTVDIWDGKYLIIDSERFLSELTENSQCQRFIMPNPTETLTIIGRDTLNYCSNYGEK